jgi:hypothetical protein
MPGGSVYIYETIPRFLWNSKVASVENKFGIFDVLSEYISVP